MEAPAPGVGGYKVLGLDDTLYGPVEIPQLVEWARDERIQPDSWLLCVSSRRWINAAELPELCSQFPALAAAAAAIAPELQPQELRKVKVFSELTQEQLHRVAGYADVQHFPVGTLIMRAGGIADSVYFVLTGSVRLKILVRGKELPISQVASGGVFGQISLFDNGPRVTDAVAESDITCARITVFNFRRLFRAAPDLAVPIILGLGRTLASRIRSDDKHLCELAARQEIIG
jgi:CRP-like cAMP-binding protein